MSQTFYLEQKKFNIPDDVTDQFLAENPGAIKGINYSLDNKTFNIPENIQQDFLNQNPGAIVADQPPALEGQKSDITYDDPELNQINQEINSRVNSVFNIPDAVPETETIIEQPPAPEPSFTEKMQPYLKNWNKSVGDFNTALQTSLDNLVLGRTESAEAWEPVTNFFNRFRDADEKVSAAEFPSYLAEGATKLIGLPAQIARDLTENPYEFFKFLTVETPKIVGELIQGAGLDPILQTRVAMGDQEAIKYKNEIINKIAQYPVETFMAPFIFKGTVKKATQLPKTAKMYGEYAATVAKQPLYKPVQFKLTKPEAKALQQELQSVIGRRKIPEVETYVRKLLETKEGKNQVSKILKEGKIEIPLKEAILRKLGFKPKEVFDVPTPKPKLIPKKAKTEKVKTEKVKTAAELEGVPGKVITVEAPPKTPKAPKKTVKVPIKTEKPVEVKPGEPKVEKPVEVKPKPKAVEPVVEPVETSVEVPIKTTPTISKDEARIVKQLASPDPLPKGEKLLTGKEILKYDWISKAEQAGELDMLSSMIKRSRIKNLKDEQAKFLLDVYEAEQLTGNKQDEVGILFDQAQDKGIITEAEGQAVSDLINQGKKPTKKLLGEGVKPENIDAYLADLKKRYSETATAKPVTRAKITPEGETATSVGVKAEQTAALNEQYNNALQAQAAAQQILSTENLPGNKKIAYENSFNKTLELVKDLELEAKTNGITLEQKPTETDAIKEVVSLFEELDPKIDYQVNLEKSRTLQEALEDPKDPASPSSVAQALQDAGQEFAGIEPVDINIAGQNYQAVKDGALIDTIKIHKGADIGTVIHERGETWYRQQEQLSPDGSFDKKITEERNKYYEKTGEKNDPSQSNREWFSDRVVDNAIGAEPTGRFGAALQRIINKFREYAEGLRKSADKFAKFAKEGKVPKELKSFLDKAIKEKIKTPKQVKAELMKDIAGRPSPTKVTYSLAKTKEIVLPTVTSNRGVTFITGDPVNINLKGEYEDFGIRYPRTYKGWALDNPANATKLLNDTKKGYNVIAVTSLVDAKGSMVKNKAYLNALYRSLESKVGKRKAKSMLNKTGDIFQAVKEAKISAVEVAKQTAVPDFSQIARKVTAVATIKDFRTGDSRNRKHPEYKIEVNFDKYQELPQPINLDTFVKSLPKTDSRVANPFYAAKQYWLTILNQESPQVRMLSDFAATGDASIFNVKPEAYQFASPQIKEIGLEKAIEGIRSKPLQEYHRTVAEMEVEAGIESITTAALGVYEGTGSEPSVMTTINQVVDADLREYLAAGKGLTGNQETVLDFEISRDGTDNIYTMELDANLKNLSKYVKVLEKAGIQFKTMPVTGDKVNLVVVDEGKQLVTFVNKAQEIYNAKTKLQTGTARFIGDFGNRAKADKKFLEIIRDYEGRTGYYSKVLRDRLPVHRPRFNRNQLPKKQKPKKLDPKKPTYELKLTPEQRKLRKKREKAEAEQAQKSDKEKFEDLKSVDEKTSSTPKYARSINLDKQVMDDALKRFELELASLESKKTQSWDKTGKIRDEILNDYGKAIKMMKRGKKFGILNTAEIDALRQINVNALHRLKELTDQGVDKDAIREVQRYYDDIFTLTSDVSSEVGRALNIHKRNVSENRMAKAFSKMERGLNDQELDLFKKINFENPREVERFLNRIGDPQLKDYFWEYWYNNILSGIPTHLVNVASNTFWGAYQIPMRGIQGGLDNMIVKFTGKERQRYASEMLPMFAGYKTGFKRGSKRALETFKTGEPPLDLDTKWDIEMGASTSAFERSPYPALRKAAPFFTLATRALRTMDVWANSIAFDTQINALAERAANQKGLKGEEKNKFVLKLRENPTKKMIEDSKAFAKYSTFMDDPGKFTEWVNQGRGKIPGGRFVIPFVNTVGNLMKRGVEMTPGVGLIRGKEYYDQPAADILSKQLVGSVIALYMIYKAGEDELIGKPPQNKSEREAFYRQGKKAYSIKYGDQWIQYRRIEPFNTVIASTVIAHDELTKEEDAAKGTEIFFRTAEGIVDNLLESSYMQGLSSLFDKYGKREQNVKRMAGSLVPYSGFWRSINKSVEAASEGKAKFRPSETFKDAFAQVVPGLSDKTPAALNVWGEEVVLDGGVLRQWLPFKYSKETDSELEKELERIGVYPSLPNENLTIRGETIEMPKDFYRDYAISYGSQLKKVLEKQIGKVKNKDPEIAIKAIQPIVDKIRNAYLLKAKSEYEKKYGIVKKAK